MSNFTLSKEAILAIKNKALFFGITEKSAIEWMIMEFSPSTLIERKKQKERRFKAKAIYLISNPDASSSQIWENGFKHGWNQFQLRKSRSAFQKIKGIRTERGEN